jgi:hypothetical protein
LLPVLHGPPLWAFATGLPLLQQQRLMSTFFPPFSRGPFSPLFFGVFAILAICSFPIVSRLCLFAAVAELMANGPKRRFRARLPAEYAIA